MNLAASARACVIVSVAAVTLLVAAGCRSSSGGKATPPAAASEVAPTATVAADATAAVPPTPGPSPTPLSADAMTAVAAGPQVGLVDYTDPDGRYVVGLPRGWRQDVGPNFVITALPASSITSVGVFCAPGISADELYREDNNTGSSLGVRTEQVNNFGAGVTVVGTNGRYVESTTALGQLVLRSATYYFEGKGCAWRVQATTSISGTDYKPLLETVIHSFRFTP